MVELFQSVAYFSINLLLICLLLVPLAVMAVVCLLYFLWDFLHGMGRGRLL